MEVALGYELSGTQNLRFFYNIFEDDAECFYQRYVQSTCPTFEKAFIKMQTEYNSIALQNRVRKYLKSLSLASIMKKKSCNVPEALEKWREVIKTFTPQGQRTHRSK